VRTANEEFTEAQAVKLWTGLPLPIGYLVTSLIIIPLVIYGMKALAKLHM
jgi:purine-cytosine permease-like protein